MSEEKITVINPFAKIGLSNANAASKNQKGKKNRCDVCVGTGVIRYEIIGDKRIETQCPHCLGTGIRHLKTVK
ncbi:MAG: hypothetical protein Q3989_00420 [Eubacteriales bacterium]|nr:hypothetical protein [Eubacteriales bacterium]